MIKEVEKQKVYIGADHAGYHLKDELKKYLNGDHDVVDLGTFSEASFDYPDIAREVGEKVLEVPGSLGILICGTGIGVCMAANKLKGIRAADCTSEEMAEMARKHNDANVLTLGARIMEPEQAKKIAQKFLDAKFAGEERHVRRVQKIDEISDWDRERNKK